MLTLALNHRKVAHTILIASLLLGMCPATIGRNNELQAVGTLLLLVVVVRGVVAIMCRVGFGLIIAVILKGLISTTGILPVHSVLTRTLDFGAPGLLSPTRLLSVPLPRHSLPPLILLLQILLLDLLEYFLEQLLLVERVHILNIHDFGGIDLELMKQLYNNFLNNR